MAKLRFTKPSADIELRANIGVHNRFDFVIEEKGKPLQEFTLGDKGEFRSRGTSVVTAHNVILNNMWTRLCGRSSFGGNIHLGSGTGAPAATDTALFTWVLGRAWTLDAQFRGFDADGVTPLGYWRGYITLEDNEQNGVTFTEVGVGYSTTASNIVTHALLQDAEGHPISIEKNNTMVLKVYATVYSTIVADSYVVPQHPSTNPMLVYLTGGAAPTMSFYLSSGRANKSVQKYAASHRNTPDVSASKSLSMSADVANKKIVGASNTFTRTEALINGINSVALDGIGMVNMNKYDNPNFTGIPVIDEIIGTGDGVKTCFAIPSNTAEPETSNYYLASVTGAVGYVQGDVCTGTIGGVEFTVKSVSANFASISCSPSFGDAAVNGSVALTGGVGSGATLVIETISAPYSSTHHALGMEVHANALPCYMNDNSAVNFTGIANYYFARSSLIKDASGKFKSYLIKSDTVVSRMVGDKQWDTNYSTVNYAVALSPDGFGADDGYAFNFATMKMRVGMFDGSSFYFDAENEIDITFDMATPETVTKVYVYKDRKFLLVSNQYVALYEQTSRNEFTRAWVVQNANTTAIGLSNRVMNLCDHVYKDGKLYSANNSWLPSARVWVVPAYGDGVFVCSSYNSNIYAVGKYNAGTNGVDWAQYTMPSSQIWNALAYDSTNGVFVCSSGFPTGVPSGSETYAVGKYNAGTNSVDWVQGTMPSRRAWNALACGNGVFVCCAAYKDAASNAYAVGKYNAGTNSVDWAQYTMPSNQLWNALAYDSTSGVFVVTCGGDAASNAYAVGKYNAGTNSVDWAQYTMPSSQRWNALAYDSINGVFVVTCGSYGPYSSNPSNAYAVGKYNAGTNSVDWAQYTMPSNQIWNALAYDNTSGVFVVTCGQISGNSNVYAAGKYNAGTNSVDWAQYTMPSNQIWNALVCGNGAFVCSAYNSNIYAAGKYNGIGIAWGGLTLKCQNVSDGSIAPNPNNMFPHTYPRNTTEYSFALMNDQFAIGDTNQPLKRVEYDFPAIRREPKFVTTHSVDQSQPVASTPEWGGAIITAKNTQNFYTLPEAERTIGTTTNSNVQYYSDCIIKAPYGLISAETSIPDGSAYVEFDTPPADGETIKLSYLTRGLNKVNQENKYYVITVSGEYQLGEQ